MLFFFLLRLNSFFTKKSLGVVGSVFLMNARKCMAKRRFIHIKYLGSTIVPS